jgi:hypothetical protein
VLFQTQKLNFIIIIASKASLLGQNTDYIYNLYIYIYKYDFTMPKIGRKDQYDPVRKKGKKGNNEPYNSKHVRKMESIQENRAIEGQKGKKVIHKKEQKNKDNDNYNIEK